MATDYIDDDMKQLLDVMSKALVPRCRRRGVYCTNYHTPYYRDGRYRKVA